MQQFKSLLIKELRNFFRSSLAYFIFFIYLFSSVSAAFYFGSYLTMHDSGLYALFYVQPIILAVVIPAVTMKMWSEEYKSGTAEFLLTQPVPYYIPVVAKFLAAFLLCVCMSLFFWPFIIYTSGWLALDFGCVILGFVGIWGIAALYCSLGCLISAFCSGIIISYLLSVFALALWIILPMSYLYEVYNNFLFAQIGFSDIIYFVSITAVLVLLNVCVLHYRYADEKGKQIKFSALIAGVLAGVVLFNIAVFNFCSGKVDLTAARLYSPKEKSKEIISLVNEPINIDVYAAREYIKKNPDYFHYMQQVVRLLKRYESISEGMISVNLNYVEPFSFLEEEIIGRGLYYEENGFGSKDYFGAFVRSADGKESVIKQFLLQRRPLLEKDIAVAILKVIQPERVRTLGVYMDPMQKIEGYNGMMLALENDYNVGLISGTEYEFLDALDVLILINPKNVPPYFVYAVDQYLMRGGRVVMFLDFFTESQSFLTNQEKVRLVDFLTKWRIQLKPEYTDDGLFNKEFNIHPQTLKLNKASMFEVVNDELTVIPFIKSDKNYVGAVLTGVFPSLYTKNLYHDAERSSKMKPHLLNSVPEAVAAVITDVDMLEDKNWVAASSPDLNPYSLIEKTGNGAGIKALIDYVSGNEIYEEMPYNDYLLNRDSISQSLNNKIFSKYEAEYKALENKINDEKFALYESSGENAEKMRALLQISDAGRNIANEEKALHNIEYKMTQEYSSAIIRMALIYVFFIPLFVMLLLLLAVKFIDKRKAAKVKEMFNE